MTATQASQVLRRIHRICDVLEAGHVEAAVAALIVDALADIQAIVETATLPAGVAAGVAS